jgi:cyclophilin family peptidyl-prolyl cis-trans isomerase
LPQNAAVQDGAPSNVAHLKKRVRHKYPLGLKNFRAIRRESRQTGDFFDTGNEGDSSGNKKGYWSIRNISENGIEKYLP